MSSVTGETGAGKSILLQALNLTLGRRGDSTLVRHGKDKAEVSAVFDVANQKKVQHYLQDQSLEDEGECILRRIISSDGRSKAFVNGVSVPLSTLKGVGELLIDMHGQTSINCYCVLISKESCLILMHKVVKPVRNLIPLLLNIIL